MLLALGCVRALAAGAAPPAHSWKLTVGDYFYSAYSGIDVNLRWRGDDTDAWAGVYRDPEFGTQARAGLDTTFNATDHLQLQPSLQIASRGFVGGSFNVQAGAAWYALAGYGITNARPYFNLNFDPNDAITLGLGHLGATGASYNLFVVADDRLHTGQRDWHLNARIPVAGMQAFFDVLRKNGLGDSGPVTGWGFSAAWEWPDWFLRVARDPYQNFSAQSAWRVAAGVRF